MRMRGIRYVRSHLGFHVQIHSWECGLLPWTPREGCVMSLCCGLGPVLTAENMRTRRITYVSCHPIHVQMHSWECRLLPWAPRRICLLAWVATRSNADSREHENAKDHICQLMPGASCANAQLIVWTTSLSTKKCVFNCLIRRWDTLSTKKGCLIAWICNSGSTKKGVINCLNCRGGIAPRKVYLIAQIADGEGFWQSRTWIPMCQQTRGQYLQHTATHWKDLPTRSCEPSRART